MLKMWGSTLRPGAPTTSAYRYERPLRGRPKSLLWAWSLPPLKRRDVCAEVRQAVLGGHEMSDMGNLSSQYFNKIDGSWQGRPDRSNRDQQMHAMFSLRGLVACGGAA